MFLAAVHLTTLYELGGATVLLAFVAKVIQILIRYGRHMGHVHEAIVGRPASPGVEAIPSMIQRFEAVSDEFSAVNQHLGQQDKKLAVIDIELHANSGSSLIDKVDKLIVSTAKASSDAAAAVAKVAEVAATAKATSDAEAAKVAAKAVADAAALAAKTAADLVVQQLKNGDVVRDHEPVTVHYGLGHL